MTKREVIRMVLKGEQPPYVPWSFKFTEEACEKLMAHYGTIELDKVLQSHLLNLGRRSYTEIGNNHFRDVFGVVWDRSIEKNIGNVIGCLLPEPTLADYEFPNPLDQTYFEDMANKIERQADLFRIFHVGFSLYERAWTMRGMESLMMDFIMNPDFVHGLLAVIADYHIAQVRYALDNYEIDAVYFGDDWGQQHGLQMGPKLWHEFIYPQLRRMYGMVKKAGKFVMIHSCGDVDELFDDLINIGVNCFNPFQPEVMDVRKLLNKYRSRLTFHGGLSTQKTLPYGSPEDVRKETRWLIELGKKGGYILSPAHAVEGDVPLENMLAFIETVKEQKMYLKTMS